MSCISSKKWQHVGFAVYSFLNVSSKRAETLTLSWTHFISICNLSCDNNTTTSSLFPDVNPNNNYTYFGWYNKRWITVKFRRRLNDIFFKLFIVRDIYYMDTHMDEREKHRCIRNNITKKTRIHLVSRKMETVNDGNSQTNLKDFFQRTA